MMTSFSNAQYLQQMMQWGATNKPNTSNDKATILGAMLLGVIIGIVVSKMMNSSKNISPISNTQPSSFDSLKHSDLNTDLPPKIPQNLEE
jgi:hypothetical protein